MDPLVLKAQKWVNETYKGKHPDFFTVEENGKTGWDTINALTRALQIELGINQLSNNFGPTTAARFDQISGTLVIGGKYNKNIVKILQCGFWCKGYDMNDLGYFGEFSDFTQGAIRLFQVDCGLAESLSDNKANGIINGMIMKAILNMNAFVLIYGGDRRVREIQRNLNRDYHKYFGLLACDGIYQRDTNQAIIYGLQCEMGMAVGVANGYFGVGTTANCPSIGISHTNKANIKLLQYALCVNDEYTGPLDGVFTIDVGESIRSFRRFMKIGNTDLGFADMPVIKALLATTGDTDRPTNACDTSMQILSQTQVNILKSAGYNTIGRYLTGTVGVGSSERPKNLTLSELNLLKANQFKIFPIYQDGGWYLEYFKKAGQGWTDARLAGAAAKSLGFKDHTTIYFACDFDVLGDEIQYIISYLRDVVESMRQNYPEYKVSLYAPRNVCTQATEHIVQITNCFVSDMSSGFSANLGYKMPRNWSFDQYHEYVLQGIPLDKVGMSGLWDVGQSEFNPPKFINKDNVSLDVKAAKEAEIANKIANKLKIFRENVGVDFKSEVEHTANMGQVTLKLKLENTLSSNPGTNKRYTITNGKANLEFAENLQFIQDTIDYTFWSSEPIQEIVEGIVGIAQEGYIQLRFKADSMTEVGVEIYVEGKYEVGNIYGEPVEYDYCVTLGIFVDPFLLPPGWNADVDQIVKDVKRFNEQLNTAGIIGLSGLALCGGFIVAAGSVGALNIVSGTVTAGTMIIQKVAEFFSTLKFAP